jgi:hypothetical protein
VEVVRAIRFKVGEGAWSLGLIRYGMSEDPSNVNIGFYWSDKPFPTHDITITLQDFLNRLRELGIYATVSSEREGSRDSSEESPSPDEVFRAWSSAYAWPKEEPTTTRGKSSGVRRSDGFGGNPGTDPFDNKFR